jgi:hypothetical protein
MLFSHMQASPGALMRELQPALPRRLQPPLPHSSTSLLQSITQQLMQQQQQEGLGMQSLPDGSWILPAVAQGLSSSSSSSSSSSDHVDSWIEPGANDTLISNLVFRLSKVRLSGTTPRQLQRLLRKPAQPAYQLLVPHEAVAAAEQAVAAARGVATVPESPSNNGVVANDQQQQQQQHSSSNNSSSSSSSSSMAWRADPATEHLLSLVPDRWVAGTSALA